MAYFGIYVLVELLAVVALAANIGVGATLLAVVGTFLAGVLLAGSQIRGQVRRLRGGLTTARGAVTDGSMIAMGTLLVVIPGLVTSVLGLLLLLPPTRALARPLITAVVVRGLARSPWFTVTAVGADGVRRYRVRHHVVDGEVIDMTDDRDPPPPSLPPRPIHP
ncbi:FxsA family protein [Mycobacterium sp. MYCO198283]|uniref:FxsA family protein n=1 Tax=Mycobacterium sp. MYCO198283 TaxID=2883505 RepID=UPI001E4F3908|nr:FxsA family protein [Mycobacterium sp. MYCO198283]MCG5433384.1 FxsA family protein [Mycobacterium sp. MYCO198283]